ncbi:MAG: phosphohydrolase, partial [Candidatus Sumerlaeaceae bacterium]
ANHHEDCGEPVSNVSAALILADKSDVLRSRVRNPKMISFDIHDRVNYAAERSEIIVEKDRHLITLKLKIDTSLCQVIDYFEIFMTRMTMSRRGANYLNCDFRLIINDVQLA